MKLLVCISKSPDTTSKIDFTDNNTKFNESGVQYIVNPYDEWYALVRALELKEQFGGSVTTISVGGLDEEPIIRKALAIGADDAVRIDSEAGDAYYTAFQISEYAKSNGLLAELLNIPFISLATKLDFNGSVATIMKEMVGGDEVIELSTPFVISAAKGMAEQRIPNMRGIMAARTKPLQVIAPAPCDHLVSYESYELPSAKKECRYVDANNMGELVSLLHNEAKVI